ncbi:MAG: hypothetical protein WBB48_07145 [Thermodesulfobacteriota bacterium]
MELEELLRDREFDEGEKRLNDAIDIAQREWENVRSSLELAGDIGEFDKEDFMIGVIEEDVIIREPLLSPTKSVSVYSPTFYPMYFVQNLLTMDEKLAKEGYRTIESLYVFVELAAKAGERLGLIGSFAMSFGGGYGTARSGWIAEKGYPLERDLFVKMFFKNKNESQDWDFFWTSVRDNLKQTFAKFEAWQNDEKLYKKEVKSKAIVKPMLV